MRISLERDGNEHEIAGEVQWKAFFDLVQKLANILPKDQFEKLLDPAVFTGGHKLITISTDATQEACAEAAKGTNPTGSNNIRLWRLDQDETRHSIRVDDRRYLLRINNSYADGKMFDSIVNFANTLNPAVIVTVADDNHAQKQPDTKPEIKNVHMSKSPNVILYGPPGTGKTYATVSVAAQLLEADAANKSWDSLLRNDDPNARAARQRDFTKNLGARIHFITFHQSYSYEDFIGGLRPELTSDSLKFKWQPGIFLRACAAAFKEGKKANPAWMSAGGNPSQDDVEQFLEFCTTAELDSYKEPEGTTYPPVVLVIDEINRANMSRVFGELITLLEEDKRLGGKEQLIVQLPNRPDCKFGVPKNLIMIGTMNTADKSLALLDLALRRRFEFHRLDPIDPIEKTMKRHVEGVGNLWEILEQLNNELAASKKSTDFAVGHAYLLNVNDKPSFESVLDRKIVPLLEEYFGGNHETVLNLLKDAGIPISEKVIASKDRRFRCIVRPVKLAN
jgi:5-methylcytosine-specific restriction protein B